MNRSGQPAPQPVGNGAAKAIRAAFSPRTTTPLSVPEPVDRAIDSLVRETLSELPPNGASRLKAVYA